MLRPSLCSATNRKLVISFPSSAVLTIHHIVTRLNQALRARVHWRYELQLLTNSKFRSRRKRRWHKRKRAFLLTQLTASLFWAQTATFTLSPKARQKSARGGEQRLHSATLRRVYAKANCRRATRRGHLCTAHRAPSKTPRTLNLRQRRYSMDVVT